MTPCRIPALLNRISKRLFGQQEEVSRMAFIGSDSEWVSSHFTDVPDKVEKLCGPLAGKSILDVGCGEMLSDFGLIAKGASRVTGLDMYPSGMSDLPKVHGRLLAHGFTPPEDYPERLAYQQYEGTRFPFEDRSFDLVLSWGAFEHVADVPSVLREIRRVVKPEGLVLIVVYPWFSCYHGSHLSDFIEEPFFHLRRDDDWVLQRLEEYVAAHPESRDLVLGHLWGEYRALNRYSAARFHRGDGAVARSADRRPDVPPGGQGRRRHDLRLGRAA
jgi:SAM-dependent methyltransferase